MKTPIKLVLFLGALFSFTGNAKADYNFYCVQAAGDATIIYSNQPSSCAADCKKVTSPYVCQMSAHCAPDDGPNGRLQRAVTTDSTIKYRDMSEETIALNLYAFDKGRANDYVGRQSLLVCPGNRDGKGCPSFHDCIKNVLYDAKLVSVAPDSIDAIKTNKVPAPAGSAQ